MIDIKLSLSIKVPGAVMFSKQLCFENSTIEDENGNKTVVETPVEGMTDEQTFMMRHFDKKTKKVFYRPATFHTRKCVPARQVINMSSEAYDHMISDFCPEWFKTPGRIPKDVWKALSEKERLELHLTRTAEHLGGEVDEYQILDD